MLPEVNDSISVVLRQRIDRGDMHEDKAQERAARRLARLQEALQDYTNEPLLVDREEMEESESSDQSDRGKTENKHDTTSADVKDGSSTTSVPVIQIPRGLFLHGQVGTGKSMLMDLFFEQAPVERKSRVHFHSFLQDVHTRIHRLKQQDLQMYGRSFHVDTSRAANPIVRVAQQYASEVTLLCFDEFQVTDVADALIMKQLFEVLFQKGTVVVATSNRPPEALYEGGLNRSYFMPFIDLLFHHCIVHEIRSDVDYRRLLSENMEDCFLVDNSADFRETRRIMDESFERLLDGSTPEMAILSASFSRSLTVEQAHPEGLVGRFQFDELCNRELGSSDYRAIARHFSIVILEGIPLLNLKDHDQARRFITLVDELYEGKCALLCSAVAYPEYLFVDGHNTTDNSESMETKVGEMYGIDVAQSTGRTVGELASVRELSFAFRRAASRLTEMCSRKWWERNLQQNQVR